MEPPVLLFSTTYTKRLSYFVEIDSIKVANVLHKFVLNSLFVEKDSNIFLFSCLS